MKTDFTGEGQAENKQHTPEELILPPPCKNLPPFRLNYLTMPPSTPPQSCHLPVSLSTITPAVMTATSLYYVDYPSDNLASKIFYLLNNSMYICPSSATHGKLLLTALHSPEERGYWWDLNSLSFPFPNLSAFNLPSFFSFKEQVLSSVQNNLYVLFIWSLPVSFRTLLHLPFYYHLLHRPQRDSSPSSHSRK